MLRSRVWGLSRQIIAQLNDHPSYHIKRRTQKFCSNVSLPIERLDNRTIVRVSGNDATDYLQGLITNDMRHLKEGTDNIEGKINQLKGMYCMFLDARGRILLDSIIYRSFSKNKSNDLIEVYYLECDSEIAPSLVKHLKLYKLRKKVDISLIDDEMEVWVEFSPDPSRSKMLESNFIGEKGSHNVLSCRDPRFPALGVRILSQKGNSSLAEDKKLHVLEPGHYRAFRYTLGVGEGIQDLPPGNSFPLEANCDYLHGVSFHKGCYVGQELTARTYHTGVVRKRLMPLELSCKEASNLSLQPDASVVDIKSGKTVGKLRGTTNFGDKCLGLGLLRVAEVLKSEDLKVGDSEVKTGKPFWWPEEAQKSVRPKVAAA